MRMRHASGSLVNIIPPHCTLEDVVALLPHELSYPDLACVRCKKTMGMYLKTAASAIVM